ncbi:MAG TPA: hypothetical protein VJ987_12775, partial [Anaerolineales bacterium]|nr:hypothetical protein [Anaerolineales bacterium]
AKPREWETAYNVYMAKREKEVNRAEEKAAQQVITPKNKSWWEKTIVEPAKKILNTKTIAGAIITAALGSTAVMAGNIASNPHVFDEARANLQREWQQVVQDHPEIQADQATKRKYLFSHPYEAFSAGYDATKAIANSIAGYADAAWQQHPLSQAISSGIQQIGDNCPEGLGEAWYRRCSATFHFGSSLVEHPADTFVGIGTTLIADPVAGAIKTAAFSWEYNNPVRAISDFSDSIHKYGLGEGIQEFVDSRASLAGQLFSDPQVKSFGLLALFVGVAFIPVVGAALATIGGGALVLKQTISSFLQIDKAIQAAPTREDVVKYATSQNIRRSVSVNLVLLALLAFGASRGIKELNQYRAFQESLSPTAQGVLADLPITRQFEILDAARGLDLSSDALEFYLTEFARSGSSFTGFSTTDALTLSNLANNAEISGATLDAFIQSGEIIRIDPAHATEFAQVVSKVTGRNVWVSTKNGSVYLSESTDAAIAAARQLAAEGPLGTNVDGLVEVIAREAMRGEGNRLVLGQWQQGNGYIQNAIDNGGVFFDTGSEVWNLVEQSGIEPWQVNQRVLQLTVEGKVSKIDFVDIDVDATLAEWSLYPDVEVPFRVREMRWLKANGESYGYEQIGNSWILKP